MPDNYRQREAVSTFICAVFRIIKKKKKKISVTLIFQCLSNPRPEVSLCYERYVQRKIISVWKQIQISEYLDSKFDTLWVGGPCIYVWHEVRFFFQTPISVKSIHCLLAANLKASFLRNIQLTNLRQRCVQNKSVYRYSYMDMIGQIAACYIGWAYLK